jgi:hypothetical protein
MTRAGPPSAKRPRAVGLYRAAEDWPRDRAAVPASRPIRVTIPPASMPLRLRQTTSHMRSLEVDAKRSCSRAHRRIHPPVSKWTRRPGSSLPLAAPPLLTARLCTLLIADAALVARSCGPAIQLLECRSPAEAAAPRSSRAAIWSLLVVRSGHAPPINVRRCGRRDLRGNPPAAGPPLRSGPWRDASVAWDASGL